MLYERVLGQDAALLHPQVAAVHCGDGPVQAAGWMRVERGSGLSCRLAATLLRLPRPGARVRTRLLITRHDRGERWIRRFGDGVAIRSQQAAGPHGELVERFGAVAFVFTLEAAGEVVRFRQQECQLRLWRCTLRLPGALAPRVDAVVGPAPGSGMAVSVRIVIRRLGLLLAYEGVVDIRRTFDAHCFVASGPARAHRRL